MDWTQTSAQLVQFHVNADPSLCRGTPEDYLAGETLTKDDYPDYTHCTMTSEMIEQTAFTHFVMMTNRQRFSSESYYPDDPIIKESWIQWFGFPYAPTRKFYKIH